jgi:hypothetical protein
MRAVLYVPYSNGDARNGFKYDKEISQKEYANAMVEYYNQHKDGIDSVFMSKGLGRNIAVNPFRKEKLKYNQQTFYYQPVEAKVFDIDGKDEKIDELIQFYKTGEQFIVIIALLNLSSADETGELESDVKAWTRESVKINKTNKMTEDEKIKSLSKKSLKLKFKDSKSSAILKNCKMIEVYSRNKFALLVESIDFVQE